MSKENTFEVAILRGGVVFRTKKPEKAQKFFQELAEAMAPERVYLWVWNGAKRVSERIANKE